MQPCCCASCTFDLVFHWPEPQPGVRVAVWGPQAVAQCLAGRRRWAVVGGSARKPGGLFRSQSLSKLRGHPLSPLWPISDSAGGGGLQTHPHRQANLSPLECEFSDLRLQIAHLQRRQGSNNNLSAEYISASRFSP